MSGGIKIFYQDFPNWLINGLHLIPPQPLVGHLQPNFLIGLLDWLLVTNMEHRLFGAMLLIMPTPNLPTVVK